MDLQLLSQCVNSPQQHASVSQGRICTDNFTCCQPTNPQRNCLPWSSSSSSSSSASPAISLGFTVVFCLFVCLFVCLFFVCFGEIFAHVTFFSNHRHSHIPSAWMMHAGCVLPPAFTRLGHACQALLRQPEVALPSIPVRGPERVKLSNNKQHGDREPSFSVQGHIHRFVCWWVGCLSSQQHASASQGRICSDNFTCCHTEIEDADPIFHLTHSQYTDTGPTSPSADPITPGAWQGSHWGCQF